MGLECVFRRIESRISESRNSKAGVHAMKGMIFDIKEMALHDGPGIRTTVFLKGCPLRCKWCHNPDGFSTARELSFNSSLCIDCGSCRRECVHEECKPFSRCIRACPRGILRIVGREVGAEELLDELIREIENA